MRISLSFIYPVHNAELTVSSKARRWLELLEDLGVNFELLLIDDGSNDDTLGEIRELEFRFAQVRVIHQPLRYGHSAAVQLGMRKARAPFVMIYNGRNCEITTQVSDLWNARLGSRPPGVKPDRFRQPLAMTSYSELVDHGSVLELGGLILVQRWNRPDALAIDDFVRSASEGPTGTVFREPLAAPHYLSPPSVPAPVAW